MPELPEAETIARQLDEELSGRKLGHVILSRCDIVHGNPAPLCALLRGRRVGNVTRRAKRIVVVLKPRGRGNAGRDGDDRLVFHLGMSGRLVVVNSNTPVEKHTHLRIQIGGGRRELRFRDPRRFGGVWFLPAADRHIGRKLGPVGHEPLQMTIRQFREVLRRTRQIKALLLDQKAIAGLGNIYCDESLHAAGIHPLTSAHVLGNEETRSLWRAIKTTLRKAIRHKGSTLMDYRGADGQPGSFQKHHRVYQREGLPCKTCKTAIVRIPAAGRSTFLCPECQPDR